MNYTHEHLNKIYACFLWNRSRSRKAVELVVNPGKVLKKLKKKNPGKVLDFSEKSPYFRAESSWIWFLFQSAWKCSEEKNYNKKIKQ